MPAPVKVAVVGGGVAALSSAIHLLEIWDARRKAHLPPLPLELHVIAPLAPHAGSEGSGLGGKAMSRSYEGRYDAAHDGMDRQPFYGPMMPERGTIPHGYHILWEYPNLRRMVRAPGEDDSLSGLFRPPGGAGVIASFQANLDDPTPGGPGIGLMGVVDPGHPETATLPVTRDLLSLRGSPLAGVFTRLFERLFSDLAGGIDPFQFADLFYAHEIDLELRVALIAASVSARGLNPETATIRVDGVDRLLTDVEYSVWAEEAVGGWARRLGERDAPYGDAWNELVGALAPFLEEVRGEANSWLSRAAILESLVERDSTSPLFALLPDAVEERLGALRRVYVETERIVRDLPGALIRLGTGRYPLWRTLHFRFSPDATFASPYSFDAAQAVRSLSFCFDTPRASRMWSADGAKIQRLWLRYWRRLEALAAENAPTVTLAIHEGRVASLTQDPAGWAVVWGGVLGHGPPGATDLGYPHQSSLRVDAPPPIGATTVRVDAVITGCGPAHLQGILAGEDLGAARRRLAPLQTQANVTLELLLWTRDPIAWSDAARRGLAGAAITGLEGPFCMLADYRCGLWSEQALAEERPFGVDRPFSGSVIESCGSYADLYAALDRPDAYGWDNATRDRIRSLLSDPQHFESVDTRPRPHDERSYHRPVADGTWSAARMADGAGWEDWMLAARWLAWGFLRQLAQIQSLGPQAVRQLAWYADRLDPRRLDRAAVLSPPAELLGDVRYVVMRNANRRSRFFCPGVGDWAKRPVSGVALPGTRTLFPAGDWTRNGLDVICMEGACLSGMRAARAVYGELVTSAVPDGTPAPIRVLPVSQWYDGVDPMARRAP